MLIKFIIIYLHQLCFSLQYVTFITLCALYTSAASVANSTDGKPKRGTSELSYSYAATDIGSKGGTRIKTITIIKNYGHKDKSLKINPELHKDEDWGSKFRDNFDSFGKIPEIPDVLNTGEKESPRKEIPIFEEIEEEQKSESENQNQENQNEENQNQENAQTEDESEDKKESNEESQDALSKTEKIKDDVEVIETKGKNNKQDDMNIKSQQIISIVPYANKPLKYRQAASILNTRPYHQIVKTYINPQGITHSTSASVPYKIPENFKITYSPLLFPPIPIQPIISSTTQISKRKNDVGKPQTSTTTQLPYIAPNIKRAYTSSSTTTVRPEESSNLIYGKTKTKSALPPRSRGLRY